jgi:hypothetical protein
MKSVNEKIFLHERRDAEYAYFFVLFGAYSILLSSILQDRYLAMKFFKVYLFLLEMDSLRVLRR